MRMHAAGRNQADQVAGAAAFLERVDQAGERRRLGDLARRDGVADARQVLHHHAAGADVEMADLGIAHLAVAAGRPRGRRCAGTRAARCAHSRSKVGVLAWRMALSAVSSRQPQPSSTTSMTGRRFCLDASHRRLDSDERRQGQSRLWCPGRGAAQAKRSDALQTRDRSIRWDRSGSGEFVAVRAAEVPGQLQAAHRLLRCRATVPTSGGIGPGATPPPSPASQPSMARLRVRPQW